MPEHKIYKMNLQPRVLELLGPSLYTNIYFVLSELIANAHDADAENVFISIQEGIIVVEDDGIGMDVNDFNNKYLDVGRESRKTSDEDKTEKGRYKMGRKGIGKLAALSISNVIRVMSIKKGSLEKAGCEMSTSVPESKLLPAIPDEEISFEYNQKGHGTRIEMVSPVANIPRMLKTFKKNISKVFPSQIDDFTIHIAWYDEVVELEDPVENLLEGMDTLKVFLDEDEVVDSDSVDAQLKKYYGDFATIPAVPIDKKADFKVIQSPIRIPLELTKKDGEVANFVLEIKGWIGTFKQRQASNKALDFSENFISIFSKRKLGMYNVMDQITSNRMVEMYIAGQFHIDLFEETELRDMALSNRQGYQSADLRYIKAMEVLKRELNEAGNRKNRLKRYKDNKKDVKQIQKKKAKEREFTRDMRGFVENLGQTVGVETAFTPEVKSGIQTEMKRLYGLKSEVDESKKMVLISHTSSDKLFADIIEELLLESGVQPAKILYTSSEHRAARIPYPHEVYDYLRDFFVDSYSEVKPFVIYLCSQEFNSSWNTVLEAGAGWVTKKDHSVVTVNCYEEANDPLEKGKMVPNMRISDISNERAINLNASNLADVIKYVCKKEFDMAIDHTKITNLAKTRLIEAYHNSTGLE